MSSNNSDRLASSASCSYVTTLFKSSLIFSILPSASSVSSAFRSAIYPVSSVIYLNNSSSDPSSILRLKSRIRSANPLIFFFAFPNVSMLSAEKHASKKLILCSTAYTLIFSIVAAPIPRLGTLMILRTARSSSPLSTTFK